MWPSNGLWSTGWEPLLYIVPLYLSICYSPSHVFIRYPSSLTYIIPYFSLTLYFISSFLILLPFHLIIHHPFLLFHAASFSFILSPFLLHHPLLLIAYHSLPYFMSYFTLNSLVPFFLILCHPLYFIVHHPSSLPHITPPPYPTSSLLFIPY